MAAGSGKVSKCISPEEQYVEDQAHEIFMKLPSVCRTCLQEDDNPDTELYQITDIFMEDDEITSQIQSFKDVLCLFVDDKVGKEQEKLPCSICLNCIEKARTAFHFIEMCRKTDSVLEKCFSEYFSEEFKNGSICVSVEEEKIEYSQSEILEPLESESLDLEEEDRRTEYLQSPKLDVEPVSTETRRFVKRTKHGDRHKCEICGKSFGQMQTLTRHKKIHSKDNNPGTPCHFCNRFFLRKDDLRRHIRTHTNERPYACHQCPKAYKQSFELKQHVIASHVGGPLLPCTICDKKLSTRNGLYIHMKMHRGEKNHACEFCEKRFITSGELKSHKLHIHTDQMDAEKFSCGFENCSKVFVTKSARRTHLKLKHDVVE
ncbi:zinc finger protein 32-like [Uranotaenia lowii]|uniref:zinc finger protein 32-like n=1 Tax=Uranotaenia lowii TaxID=190385 RepID=UPI0024785E4B|nr:zinc finger protein 32-like [Uranotaenia lowii]